jgi:ribosomal protein S2
MGRVWVPHISFLEPKKYVFIYLKMKDNIHILKILKQLSKVNSNFKMEKSKFFIQPWVR